MFIIKFLGDEVKVKLNIYPYGGLCLDLIDTENDKRIGTASLSMFDLDEDEIAIQTWSENAGILEKLMDTGIVEKPHKYRSVGFHKVPICHLTNEFLNFN